MQTTNMAKPPQIATGEAESRHWIPRERASGKFEKSQFGTCGRGNRRKSSRPRLTSVAICATFFVIGSRLRSELTRAIASVPFFRSLIGNLGRNAWRMAFDAGDPLPIRATPAPACAISRWRCAECRAQGSWSGQVEGDGRWGRADADWVDVATIGDRRAESRGGT